MVDQGCMDGGKAPAQDQSLQKIHESTGIGDSEYRMESRTQPSCPEHAWMKKFVYLVAWRVHVLDIVPVRYVDEEVPQNQDAY